MHLIKLNSSRARGLWKSLSAGFLCAFLLAGTLVAGTLAAQEALNRIVLRVNDEIMTLYDFEQRKESELTTLLANPNLSPAERQEQLGKVSKDVAQQAFRELLLQSFARQNGITVSERDVDDSVRRIQEQQGLQSTQELLRALEEAGMSLEMLRANLKQEMLLSSVVRREVSGKIEVTDDELRAYYRNHPEEFQVPEERKVKEVIFLEDSGLATDELKAKAQQLYEAVSGGADFEQEVASYQDQGLATGVIDLGWVKTEDLEKALGEAAFAIEIGQYTPPTEARGGFHVVFAEEAKEGFVRPFAEVQELIANRERNRRFGPELRKFMANLEARSHIVENLPTDAVGFRSLAEDFDPESELQEFRAPLTRTPPDTQSEDEDSESSDAD